MFYLLCKIKHLDIKIKDFYMYMFYLLCKIKHLDIKIKDFYMYHSIRKITC